MIKPELILGPIIGGLSDTSVNLWGRANGPGTLHAWLGQKEDLSDARPAGTSAPLDVEYACTGVAPVRGLEPKTTYFYNLRLDDSPPPVQYGYAKFTTFPSPKEMQNFSFAFGSCFCPTPKSDGLIFKSIEDKRRALDKDNCEALRFLLLTGDQVYADDWEFNGLSNFPPNSEKRGAQSFADYCNVYQHTWQNEHHRTLLKNIPAFMTLDDHEVDDDWRWKNSKRLEATLSGFARFERWLKGRPSRERKLSLNRARFALKAYWCHQGMHGPQMIHPPEFDKEGQYILNSEDPGSLAYEFTYGAAAFFVLDTRSMRVKKGWKRKMLGDGQWKDLTDWLLKVKDQYPVKFIVTSSALLYGIFGDFLGDRWTGFRTERDTLLRLIGEQHVENVYLIAGDLHSAHAITAQCGPRGNPVTIREFCSTPFEQKGNWAARWLYCPVLTGAAYHQKRHFVTDKPNYGVVHVHFRDGAPQVDFELFGAKNEKLAHE